MIPVECCREEDVLDALRAARWPARCDDELRTHVAACSICGDLVEVAGPLLDLSGEAWSEIRVPSPGTVWWRAQLRARREAARQASRPIGIAQAVAAVCVLLLTFIAAWTAAPWFSTASLRASEWLASAPALMSLDIPRVTLPDVTTLARGWWLGALLCFWLIVGPLALYLALADNDS